MAPVLLFRADVDPACYDDPPAAARPALQIADAALTVEQVTEALAPHHPGAAEAAAAWARAGLVVAHTATALVVYTPAPDYIPTGQVPRDYWDGNRLTKPYEVIVDADRGWMNHRLQALPLDPQAEARSANLGPH